MRSCSLGALPYRLLKTYEQVVLEVWILEDPTDRPDGRHFVTDRPDGRHCVLGLLACWCEDPLNLLARGNTL